MQSESESEQEEALTRLARGVLGSGECGLVGLNARSVYAGWEGVQVRGIQSSVWGG